MKSECRSNIYFCLNSSEKGEDMIFLWVSKAHWNNAYSSRLVRSHKGITLHYGSSHSGNGSEKVALSIFTGRISCLRLCYCFPVQKKARGVCSFPACSPSFCCVAKAGPEHWDLVVSASWVAETVGECHHLPCWVLGQGCSIGVE